jgi:hypothetical protein
MGHGVSCTPGLVKLSLTKQSKDEMISFTHNHSKNAGTNSIYPRVQMMPFLG